jgi:hypothetical protein
MITHLLILLLIVVLLGIEVKLTIGKGCDSTLWGVL